MIQPNPNRPEDEIRSEELQQRVRKNRARISTTIDSIGHELSVIRFLERSLDETAELAIRTMSEKSGKLAGTAVETLRRNPLPSLLIGAGLLCWIFKSQKNNTAKKGRPNTTTR